MRSRLSYDLQKIGDPRKTAVINNKLNRLNIETGLSDGGKTLHLLAGERSRWMQGTLNWIPCQEHPTPYDWTSIRWHRETSHSSPYKDRINLICIYSPTLQATPEVKDQLYAQLDNVVKRTQSYEHIYLLGVFNEGVGSDQVHWPNVFC